MWKALERQWFRYNDPLRGRLGAAYDREVDAADVKRAALARSGGTLTGDEIGTVRGEALERSLDGVLRAASSASGTVSAARLSYLAQHYDDVARQKPDFADWFVAYEKEHHAALLLRSALVALAGGIRPGAAEALGGAFGG